VRAGAVVVAEAVAAVDEEEEEEAEDLTIVCVGLGRKRVLTMPSKMGTRNGGRAVTARRWRKGGSAPGVARKEPSAGCAQA
jgi:hypothetical protein